MKILIPMAGKGKRFEDAGYSFPKPLIDINGKPMIQIIIENLNFPAEHIFLCQKEHSEKYSLKELLDFISPNCKIVQVKGITEGAACTALLAKELINNDEELIIANSDQWVDWNNQHFLSYLRNNDASGGIVTFIATHPKWSFVKINDKNDNEFICSVLDKYSDVVYKAGVSIPHDERVNWLRLTVGPGLHQQKFISLCL